MPSTESLGKLDIHMKKKLLALLLAMTFILMSVAATSCSGEGSTPPPAGGGTGDANEPGGTQASAGTEAPDTEAPVETNEYGFPREFFEDYMPNDDAQYSGKVGISGTAGVLFDDFRVRMGTLDEVFRYDFEDGKALPDGMFTTFGGAVADWQIAEDGDNHALTYKGSGDSVLTVGNNKWTGKYTVTAKVKLAAGGEARLYFCVKDENNLYYATATETTVSLHQIENGTDKELNTIPIGVKADEMFPMSVTVNLDGAEVYIDSENYFNVGEDLEEHVYAGKFGFSVWSTDVYFDNVKIVDSKTGEVLFEEDFEGDCDFLTNATFGIRNGGNWTINPADIEIIEIEGGNHVLHIPASCGNGPTVLFDGNIGDGKSTYTFTYDGYVVSGGEAFPCVWDVKDTVDSNGHLADYLCYNLGGWSKQCGFQTIIGGNKTADQTNASAGIVDQTWQHIRVELISTGAILYLDDNLVQFHTY